MAIIQVNQLTKHFTMGKVTSEVLKGIDMEVEQGEFVSIMGPSGSGKSTLLYLIGGLDKPTSGEIVIAGKSLSQLKDRAESIMRRRDIGFVFQFYNLVPNLTVMDNVLLPVLLDGKRTKTYINKLKEILEIVGLEDKLKHTPRELSGGQQQRVAIARALINDPQIILADEPIGNLDSKSGTDIMSLFHRINKDVGKTIVQVTHSEEAAKYGMRTIHVRDGLIHNQDMQTLRRIQ